MSQEDRQSLEYRREAADTLIEGYQRLLSELEADVPTDPKEKQVRFMQAGSIVTALNWLMDEREAIKNLIEYYGG